MSNRVLDLSFPNSGFEDAPVKILEPPEITCKELDSVNPIKR